MHDAIVRAVTTATMFSSEGLSGRHLLSLADVPVDAPGTTVSAPTTSQSMARPYPLTSAAGEMTIDVPVSGLLASTTVARPLHMWIFLLRRTSDRTSRDRKSV